jgi:quercetin dioxygenase-like cupin family protein
MWLGSATVDGDHDDHNGAMMRIIFLAALAALAALLLGAGLTHAASQQKLQKGGYVIENDADVAKAQPGPHNGGGRTVGYSFFAEVPKLSLVFRKRILRPGSAIGYHMQAEDEIYYVLSGRGVMTLDGKDVNVGPGTAVLTRTGSSHGLKPLGTEDLVVIINYLVPPK